MKSVASPNVSFVTTEMTLHCSGGKADSVKREEASGPCLLFTHLRMALMSQTALAQMP